MLQTFHTLKTARVKAVDFSRYRSVAALALYSGELVLFDYRYQKVLYKREISASPLRCAKFYKNFIFTASDDGFLRVLDHMSLSVVYEVRACYDFLRAVEIVEDFVYTAGDDGKLRVWQFNKDFRLVAEGKACDGFVMSISLSRDCKRLATAGQDGNVRIWDISIFNASFEARLEKGDFDQYKQNKQDKTVNLAETAISLTRTAKSLAKTSLQGLLSTNTLVPSALRFHALMPNYTPNFTLKLHDGCCNSCDFCDCPALQQNNPYAESTQYFVASCGDDDNVFITDLFSRQIVKKFDAHKDCVSCVKYCAGQYCLFSASEDNTVSVVDLGTFEVQRTLNYSLERAWCVATTSDGVGSIIAVGFDQGVIFARFGDNTLVWDQAKNKMAIYARYLEATGEFLNHSNTGIQVFTDLAYNYSKNLQIAASSRVQFSPNTKIIACQYQEAIHFYSVSTGKEKMVESARSIAFARDFVPDYFYFADKLVEGADKHALAYVYQSYAPEIEYNGIYAILPNDSKRYLSIKANEEVLAYTELDFTPRTLFSGPIIAVAGASEIAFFTWDLQYLTNLYLAVNKVVFNTAGDVMLLLTDKSCYICAVNFGTFSSQQLDEVDGLDDSVTVFGQLDNVKSAIVWGNIFVYSDGENLFQVFLQEMTSSDAQAMRIGHFQSIIDIISVYDDCVLLFSENQGKMRIEKTQLDKAIMEFRNCVAAGNYEGAIKVCREQFCNDSARVLTACETLAREGRRDLLDGISQDAEVQLQVCLKYELYDNLPSTALEASHLGRKRYAADIMVQQGMLRGAASVYKQLGDLEMVLLCSFILGDKYALAELSSEHDSRIAFRARAILGESVEDLLIKPADKACYEWRTRGAGELCDAWKAQCKNGADME